MKKTLLILAAALVLLTGCGKKPAGPIRHQFTLDADQPDAAAYVMGKRFALPHEFKMTPGNYLFRIEKNGYAPAWFACRVLASGIQIRSSEGEWTPFRAQQHVVELKPQGGSVLIQSTPKAVDVIINDKVIGATPLVLTGLPVGEYTAQLRSPNYAERALSWEIKDARPVIIRADLKSNIGAIELNSTPENARLFIDGKLVGETPYRGSLSVGKYQIRLERDGYLPYQSHITVGLGQTVRETFAMTASPGALEVTSSPSGAQVTINGQVRGTTPLVLQDIPAGKYAVTVSQAGFDNAEETVEVAAGSRVTRNYDLVNSRGGMELNIYPAGVKVYMNGKEIGTVEPGEGKTQTKLIRVGNLAPGTYTIKVVHKRTDPEIRRIKVQKGQITRPPRIELWVPNAEITWRENGKSELGMIHGESDAIILFGPAKGIRYEIDKSLLKNIKWLDDKE